MAVTLFICHVGYQVTKDVVHRLADGIDPAVITAAEAAAGSVDGVIHAHARARWTGRTLRLEIEGWVDPDLTVSSADAIGPQIAQAIASQLPEVGSFTWTPGSPGPVNPCRGNHRGLIRPGGCWSGDAREAACLIPVPASPHSDDPLLIKGQDKVIAVLGLADTRTVDARRADDHHHLVAAGHDLFDL